MIPASHVVITTIHTFGLMGAEEVQDFLDFLLAKLPGRQAFLKGAVND